MRVIFNEPFPPVELPVTFLNRTIFSVLLARFAEHNLTPIQYGLTIDEALTLKESMGDLIGHKGYVTSPAAPDSLGGVDIVYLPPENPKERDHYLSYFIEMLIAHYC